ncbi:hypothetical protein [Dactylosporangium maewongense]|uniref:hypothetical protein n=1 Tax=Dactylosporangium maewongense TaxID=634393 RepID=UPI0031CEBC0C
MSSPLPRRRAARQDPGDDHEILGLVIACCVGAVVVCAAGLGLLTGHAAGCADQTAASVALQAWTAA